MTTFTDNEKAAIVVLIDSCLANMGGSHVDHLDVDPFTWVGHDDLTSTGRWNLKQAQGVFGSLTAKGVITEADVNEYAIEHQDVKDVWNAAQTNEETTMNDQVETPVTEEVAEEATVDTSTLEAAVATAEAGVATAQAAVDALKKTTKTTNDALKNAKGNAKQANAYMKSIGDRTDENAADYDAGKESADGWNAEVERLSAEVETNKATRASNAEALKEAKAALRTAKAELRAAGKPTKRKPAAGTRSAKLADDTVISRTEEELPKGVMGIVAGTFDGKKTYAVVREEVRAELKKLNISSNQWFVDEDAYIQGYVKGAHRIGLIVIPTPVPAEAAPAAA